MTPSVPFEPPCPAAGSAATPPYYLAHVLSDRGRLNEAKGLLESALRARGRFTHRKEAVAWLERLTKKPQ